MALTSVATAVWNQIAETQKLKTAWAKKAFALNPEEMQQAEDKEYKALARAVGHDVAASYQDVKPLLLENEAISRFTQAQPMYREALPQVTSIAEALILASMERPLSQTQQKLLKMLLAADLA